MTKNITSARLLILLQIHAFHNENYVRKHTPVTDGNGVLIVAIIRICSKNIIYQTYKKVNILRKIEKCSVIEIIKNYKTAKRSGASARRDGVLAQGANIAAQCKIPA